MGACCSIAEPFVVRDLPTDLPNVILLGLDGAGKSSLFYRLKINVVLTTQPTKGYNVHIFNPNKGRHVEEDSYSD